MMDLFVSERHIDGCEHWVVMIKLYLIPFEIQGPFTIFQDGQSKVIYYLHRHHALSTTITSLERPRCQKRTRHCRRGCVCCVRVRGVDFGCGIYFGAWKMDTLYSTNGSDSKEAWDDRSLGPRWT